MKILVIDNTRDPSSWGSRELTRFSALAPGATFYVRRAPEQDLPKDPSRFDRIIISGSKTSVLSDEGWIGGLRDFLKKTLESRRPTLGVCYGHQMLMSVAGGSDSLRVAATPEFGWAKIRVVNPSPLLEGVPTEFHSFAAHYDEVHKLPPGVEKIAESDACEIQAFHFKDRPVFGMQFHPERDLRNAGLTFEEQRKKGNKNLLHPHRSEELYDSSIGEVIFRNFFKL